MKMLENQMVCDKEEYSLNEDKYDSYFVSLAEKEDKQWEDCDCE